MITVKRRKRTIQASPKRTQTQYSYESLSKLSQRKMAFTKKTAKAPAKIEEIEEIVEENDAPAEVPEVETENAEEVLKEEEKVEEEAEEKVEEKPTKPAKPTKKPVQAEISDDEDEAPAKVAPRVQAKPKAELKVEPKKAKVPARVIPKAKPVEEDEDTDEEEEPAPVRRSSAFSDLKRASGRGSSTRASAKSVDQDSYEKFSNITTSKRTLGKNASFEELFLANIPSSKKDYDGWTVDKIRKDFQIPKPETGKKSAAKWAWMEAFMGSLDVNVYVAMVEAILDTGNCLTTWPELSNLAPEGAEKVLTKAIRFVSKDRQIDFTGKFTPAERAQPGQTAIQAQLAKTLNSKKKLDAKEKAKREKVLTDILALLETASLADLKGVKESLEAR